MSYKERVVTSIGYSRLGTEAEDGVGIQRDIENGRTVRNEERSVLIPFHAVDRGVITVSTTDKADKNPYGCVAEGGGSNKADSAKACVDSVG